jgi:hypothetical protein
MSDYTETLKQIPAEGLQQIVSHLSSKPYLDMACETIKRNGSHTIHYGTVCSIELRSTLDIDSLIEQLAKVMQ